MSLRTEASVSLSVALKPLIERRQELIAQRDQLTEEIGTLSDDIARELALAGEKSLRCGAWTATLVESAGRLTLDKHRLAELGVSPDVIVQASVRGQPSVTLQVRKASED